MNFLFVIYRPGGTIDVQDRIVMEEKHDLVALYRWHMFLYDERKYSLLFFCLLLFPNWDLVSSSSITLENESVDDTIERDRLYLEEGLDNAIISAYQEANKEIKIEKNKSCDYIHY